MISERQFADAITFIKTYRDALECTEQIAERRASYQHYEGLTNDIVDGMKNNQIKLDSGHKGVTAGSNFQSFSLARAHSFTKGIWQKYGLYGISSRDDFNTKLDKAINDLQG